MNESPGTKSISRKPINLFLDDETDDDFNLFNDKSKKKNLDTPSNDNKSSSSNNAAVQSHSKAINLFADTDDVDDFDAFLRKNTVTPRTETKSKNLFDDDDDFDSASISFPQTSQAPKPSRSTILSTETKKDPFLQNLFDDEPPEDDFEIFKKSVATTKVVSNTEKPQAIAKDLRSDQPKPIEKISKKMNLFDDESDDNDSFENLMKSSAKPKRSENESDKLIVEEPNKIVAPSDATNFISATKSSSDAKVDEVLEKTTSPTTKPKTNFNSVRLFDDIPPEDDDEFFSSISSERKTISKPSASSVQKQTNEFYNDFSETITVSQQQQQQQTEQKENSLSTALFNDTSPVDEEIKSSEKGKKIEEEPEKKRVTENKSEFSKKLNVFNKSGSQTETTENITKPPLRKPKKLNIGNFDINVAALLPGAKRINPEEKAKASNRSIEEVIESPKSDESDSSRSSSIEINSTATVTSSDNVDSSGRLVNLTRNRAKGLNRRPSTRQGRQQQYKQSLRDAQSEDDNRNSADVVDNEFNSNTEEAKQNDLNKANNNSFATNSTPARTPKIDSHTALVKEIQTTLNNNGETESTEKLTASTKTILFDDNNLKSDKAFHKENKTESMEDPIENETNKVTTNKTSLSLFDVNENEDIFSTPSAPIPKPSTTLSTKSTPVFIDDMPPELDTIDDNTQSGENNKSLLSKNAMSLFGDDEDDDFENDLFDSPYPKISQNFTPNDEPPTLSIPANTTIGLFDDNLNEDDEQDWDSDIVSKSDEPITSSASASAFINKSPPALTKETSATKNVTVATVAEVAEVAAKSVEPPQKASLFSDSDSDNEGIFGKSRQASIKYNEKPKETSKLKPSQPATSLFGESDDDDDNLFGKPQIQSEPKQMPSASKKIIANTPSIFGDDESSGDDLFGSGKSTSKASADAKIDANKAISSEIPKSAAVLNEKSTKLFESEDDDDDDLFSTKPKSIFHFSNFNY